MSSTPEAGAFDPQALLAEPGDGLEVPVGRFVVDLVRADGELVEVQTGGFGPLADKLDALLDEHRIRVVHPVAAERRIVRVDEHGQVLSARRSPKRATAAAVFDKLVAFPSLLTHPNLTIEVLLLREDHIRSPRPTTTQGRTQDPGERRLVEVLDRVALRTPEDILAALPTLPLEPFSTRELAALLRCSTLLAQRTLYCLRMIGIVEPAGKRGRAPLHARATEMGPATADALGGAESAGMRLAHATPSCGGPIDGLRIEAHGAASEGRRVVGATRRKEQSRPIGWPPGMKARRLRRDEAGPLRELRLRALTDAPRELGCFLDEEAAFPSSYWRAIAEDTQVADRRVSVVADDGEQLVGMVGGDWDEQSGRVHLVALWVEPSSRGRGVGKALVAEVLSWARERQAHRVELWVVDDALAAAALYASCGFVETGVHQAVPYSPEQTEKLLVRLM